MALSVNLLIFFAGSAFVYAQDFKSTFVQDDFLPIPLSAPLADSVFEGESKQDPRCLKTSEFGNGTKQIVRYYFDTTNSSCSTFTYSGEGGNQNNFLTEIDCLNNCYIDVNEGAPLKEEDVHMIFNQNSAAIKRCLLAGIGKMSAEEQAKCKNLLELEGKKSGGTARENPETVKQKTSQ